MIILDFEVPLYKIVITVLIIIYEKLGFRRENSSS